ncbi:hypothetical protein O6H91_10G006800 [Diphasiastrum complanatum]|uniref:Uncharacterized protein n=1 Tax=Diphasiastrum complanatum TaxID=34168 RepID=A0ACC2CE26_DIPCM|nr:hypothetical protein O6H91_10G006800 [Diphasiastrum complanatum]
MAGGASVVLLSGGLDSATLLYQRTSQLLYPLFINYGQKGALMEEQACEKLCKHLCLKLARIDMSHVGEAFRTLQMPARFHIPFPHRNLVLLAVGASYASQVGVQDLAISIIKDDLGSYSSSSQKFMESFQKTTSTLQPPVTVTTPLSNLTKVQVVTFASTLGVPLFDTYSCMVGHKIHCGHCLQCRARKEAFCSAEIEEPVGFYG